MIKKEKVKVIYSESKDNFRILLSKTEVNGCHLYSFFTITTLELSTKPENMWQNKQEKPILIKKLIYIFEQEVVVKTVVLSFDFGSSLVILEIVKAKRGKNNQRDKNVEYPAVERSNSLGFWH